eukprot:jgi/Psemu1/28721/gm1.28721_g
MMSPRETFNFVIDAIRRLFTTPIAAWTWGQWFLSLILLSLISSCFGGGVCAARRGVRNRRYRRDQDRDGYYYASRSVPEGDGGGGGDSELPPRENAPSTPYRLAGTGTGAEANA